MLTVARVRVDGLEEAEGDPEVDGDDVEVPAEGTVDEGAANGRGAEDHDFSGVSIFRSETERCRVFVMNFVNVLV